MDWLRAELEARDWTCVELAARVGVSPWTVSGWLVGRTRPQPGHERRLRALLKRHKPATELAEACAETGVDPAVLAAQLRAAKNPKPAS